MLSFFRSAHCRHRLPPFRPWQHAQSRTFFFKKDKANVPALYKPRKEPWITPTMILVGFIPFFTFGLGTWQLYRLKWKINLIDELEEKLQLQPLSLPRRINLDVIPEFVFRKVIIRGKWDHEHTMLLTPRVREGVHGVHVVTPLKRENGTTVLVDRGFVSNEFVQDTKFQKDEGEVEVLGMLRTSQKRNSFTPDNLPEENKWFWTDVESMAEYAGGENANVQPVFVEQIFEGHAGDAALCVEKGIPIGRPATVDLRNAHLSYVITWYGLSALTSFMFVRVLLKRRKSGVRRLPRYT
ncbi:mitochondrial protein required for respiration [Dendrothele bispora CBS 962.96]|uniref:SURF1-like protein n=1 Tax=Dendrothele bispora (strain CBS 962.96) TaxID=1314807 RepID=A0A4S8MX28_DENBC|nr:mitochondrial protein required for respiration [Dendrothele bispora CBS 962.96]